MSSCFDTDAEEDDNFNSTVINALKGGKFYTLPFSKARPSMIMFIGDFEGVLPPNSTIFHELPCIDDNNIYKDLPVGPDGTIVGKGLDTVRIGARRIGRSLTCFRNSISVDISVMGGNVNLKLSSKQRIQGSGARSIAQAELAVELLINQLNKLPCVQQEGGLISRGIRTERLNYNIFLGHKLNLNETALRLSGYAGLNVIYNNTLNTTIRAEKLIKDFEKILSLRSKQSKRSKNPTVSLTIRKSGRIMIGGTNIEGISELYYQFMEWVSVNLDAIKLVPC